MSSIGPISTLPPLSLTGSGVLAGGRSERRASVQQSETALSQEQLRQVQELKARDREVRAHEQAHKRVGGPYAGAISYSYVRGPDGVRYVAAGNVPIDTAPVAADPKATISKMQIVKAAALAPAEPSAADRAVAQLAQRHIYVAQSELNSQRNLEASARLEGQNLYDAAASVYGGDKDTDGDRRPLLARFV